MTKTVKEVLSYIWKGVNAGAVAFTATFVYVYIHLKQRNDLDSVFSYYLNIMFSALIIMVIYMIVYYVIVYFICRKYKVPIWILCLLSCILGYVIYFTFLVIAGIPFSIKSFIIFTILLTLAEAITHLIAFFYKKHRKKLAQELNERIKARKN